MEQKWTEANNDQAEARLSRELSIRYFWCITCEKQQTHDMVVGTELGRCRSCQSLNYAPMGDID